MKLTIKRKLFISFYLIILANLFLGLYFINTFRLINDQTKVITGDWLPGVSLIRSIDKLVSDYQKLEFEYLIVGNPADLSAITKSMDTIKTEINNDLASYEKTINEDRNRKLFNDVKTSWENLNRPILY